MQLIVDLDDTLVNSTNLNNDAYNFSLEKYGYKRIATNERITRENLYFAYLPILQDIIQAKQNYFTLPWLPFRLVLNKILIHKLELNGSQNNVLWTKADKMRTLKILELCDLNKYFNQIIFDSKESLDKSLLKLKDVVNTNEFIIYENNKNFFNGYELNVVDVIKNKWFDICGYKFDY